MNFLEHILVAAIWGASFLFMRIAAPEFGPIPLMALRVGIAMVALAPVLRSAGARQQCREKLWPLFVVAVTISAAPFCLLAYAALSVDAGMDSVLNATMPLWAALIASIGFQVSMSRHQMSGLLIGFVGVVVLVHDTLSAGAAGVPLAIAAALLAALFYGFAVNYSKRHLAGVKPYVVAFGSQFLASLVLWPLALTCWPRHPIGLTTWGCMIALGIVSTALACLLFFRLIERAGATYAASVTFLIPVFGVVWGATFLGEKVTPLMLAGCLIVLAGTAIASGKFTGMKTRRA
ncbi:MAG TPA: DMT family transporter [Paraburkholderia sp.]|jgi:drug/metabolite transporter (DMT)-like permease|nr:DMT family transporter [Paraburkholderia sp.]